MGQYFPHLSEKEKPVEGVDFVDQIREKGQHEKCPDKHMKSALNGHKHSYILIVRVWPPPAAIVESAKTLSTFTMLSDHHAQLRQVR